jgi:biopolymer transport protein ExbD
MAEMTQVSSGKHEKGKSKKMSTRVDLTPMVDLAFLLITFFMLTTTLIKPQTMEISMPSKDKVKEEEQTKVKASKAVTILICGQDSLFYYEGTRGDNNIDPPLILSNYSPDGIRTFLLKKNAEAVLKIEDLKKKAKNTKMLEDTLKSRIAKLKGAKNAPVILIKAADNATYNNLVDILDEMNICNIGRYAIVDINSYDRSLIEKFRKGKV